MPYVFELDIPYKTYDIGKVSEEIEKLGGLGAYYHVETSVCVVGAKDRSEAIDFIFNFFVNNDLDFLYEYFAENFGDIIIQELVRNYNFNIEDPEEVLELWLDKDDLKKPIFDKYKNMLKSEMSSDIIPGLPHGIESEIKKELEEVGKRVREHDRVKSKDFERLPMMDCIFIKSKVLNYLRKEGYRPTREIIDGSVLNKAISDTFDKAITEARAHGRETVEIEDFKTTEGVSVDDTFFVKSVVYKYFQSKGFTPSSDVLKGGEVIDKTIAGLLGRAIKNAKKDNRLEFLGEVDFE